MSKVRCSSIKGLNVPASGPEINLNRFSHGQPLDMGGCNITTGTLTINNVRITTCNSTTLNATNVICTGGDVDLSTGDQLIMPNGNSAVRCMLIQNLILSRCVLTNKELLSGKNWDK